MKIIIITGQSASGKTDLAIKLAQENRGEIVNFDSRQIYKKLDIITGKDLPKNSKFKIKCSNNGFSIGYYLCDSTSFNYFQPLPSDSTIKLWLYDIVDPKQYFSSFDYAHCAKQVIHDLLKKGKTPILVGGTYLYLYHLLYKVETENIPPDFTLRKKYVSFPISALQNDLKEISVQSFNRLNNSDKNNPQRLIRKIELARHYRQIGRQVPSQMEYKLNNYFKDKNIEFTGLAYDKRENLMDAIIKRINKRISQGAIEEVQRLLDMGYTENDFGMKTIGYQQIIRYLKGEMTKQEAIDEWTLREYQYTKRQLTFMKKDPNIKWRLI